MGREIAYNEKERARGGGRGGGEDCISILHFMGKVRYQLRDYSSILLPPDAYTTAEGSNYRQCYNCPWLQLTPQTALLTYPTTLGSGSVR